MTNWVAMFSGRAPSERRRPISPRRSSTVTTIVLAIPTAPTSRAIPPSASPSVVSDSSVACRASASSLRVYTPAVGEPGEAAAASNSATSLTVPGWARTYSAEISPRPSPVWCSRTQASPRMAEVSISLASPAGSRIPSTP